MRSTELKDLTWRKSSYSGTQENCVEAAFAPEGVAVRDSKDPDGPALLVAGRTFTDFLVAVREDRLSRA